MDFVAMLVARWHALERREVMVILVFVVLLAAVTAGIVRSGGYCPGNRGFGPDWACSQPGDGEAVCIKKPPPSPRAGGG
jgi:hypothetical protein